MSNHQDTTTTTYADQYRHCITAALAAEFLTEDDLTEDELNLLHAEFDAAFVDTSDARRAAGIAVEIMVEG